MPVGDDTGLHEERDPPQIGLSHCSCSNNSNASWATQREIVHFKATKIKKNNSRVKLCRCRVASDCLEMMIDSGGSRHITGQQQILTNITSILELTVQVRSGNKPL